MLCFFLKKRGFGCCAHLTVETCWLYLHEKVMLVGKQFTSFALRRILTGYTYIKDETGVDGCHGGFSFDCYWHWQSPNILAQICDRVTASSFLKVAKTWCTVSRERTDAIREDIWERETERPTGSQKMRNKITLFRISPWERNTFSFSFSFSQLMEHCESQLVTYDKNLI